MLDFAYVILYNVFINRLRGLALASKTLSEIEMKKILTLLALLIFTAGILILLVGCREDDSCVHEWGPQNVVDAPSCTKGGYSISTCTKCGESTRTILYPSDHPYSEQWSFDGSYHWREATCQHTGQTTEKEPHVIEGKNCKVCGALKASQGLSYRSDIEADSYIVTGLGTTLETDIVVARYYNGKTIVAVADAAFENARGIRSIHLQETVTSVGARAFANSASLTEVTLSAGLEYMGSCLFIGCDSLTTVIFLGTVEEFEAIEKAGDWDGGNTGFIVKCNDGNITPRPHTYSEEWSYNNTHHWRTETCGHDNLVADYGEHTFEGKYCTSCGTVKASQGLTYSADIESGTYIVTGLGTTLETDIVVARYYNGKEIVAVADSAFANSRGITAIHLQEYIKRIGDYAFANSVGLTEVTLSAGLEYMGSCLFIGCDSLTTVIFLGTVEEFEAIEKAGDWDGGNTGFIVKCNDGNITPRQHTYSEEWSYNNTHHWRTDACGHDTLVADYGEHTFEGSQCTGCGIIKATQGLSYRGDLTTGTYTVIGIGTTLETDIVVARYYNSIEITSVGDYAFGGIAGLKSVHLQKYIRRVGDYAFADSADLESVTLTKGLEYIGSEIFRGCDSLTTVVFQGSVAEFEAIEKAENWSDGHTGYTIECFDGKIEM